MTILAIDTSSRHRSLAILCDARGALVDRAPGGADRPVTAGIAELLARSTAVEAVVVAVGPGSYTGVRSGMAAALGVAQGLDVPLHRVGSLEIVARAAPGAGPGIAVGEAGRGAIYAARFSRADDGPRIEPARWIPAAALVPRPGEVVAGFDAVPVPGSIVLGDHAAVLAAAVPSALRRPPLERAGLAAEHVNVFEQSW